ncbi:HNH endonuclease [Sinorhizobium meliloti]|uniref:HNH endonuclease n=1 Tax=Rhizobium meliloti TaxID=382 RepID=UPI0004A3BFB1|nr:HNH endonuclease signature motif containing protein [Sinorhizobium meliloti]ARS70880.1 HNH endonuclease [Sinorhizobium meliloti RU11/001]RVM38513.1 HNH endonuclease [Sinorhizobium meliloti]
MAKLKTIKPLVSSLKPLVGTMPGDEKSRARQEWRGDRPSRQWLKSAWWQRTRQRILVRDQYTCKRCGLLVAGKGEAHVDHIEPHNEDRAKFFCTDEGLQTLCVICHTKHKQAEERRARLLW